MNTLNFKVAERIHLAPKMGGYERFKQVSPLGTFGRLTPAMKSSNTKINLTRNAASLATLNKMHVGKRIQVQCTLIIRDSVMVNFIGIEPIKLVVLIGFPKRVAATKSGCNIDDRSFHMVNCYLVFLTLQELELDGNIAFAN